MRTVLIEATPWNPATGEELEVALAGGGRRAYRHRDRNDWIAGVSSEPRFAARINFDQNGFSGGAIPEAATLIFQPSSRTYLDELAAMLWPGAPVEVYGGDDELEVPSWQLLVAGVIESVSIADGGARFVIRDLTGSLDKPVVTARFAGTGGLEGAELAAERIKRRSWGYVANVEARLLSEATLVYEVGDPAFALREILDVRDMGRSSSELVLVEWAGTAAATLAALEAAEAPDGGAAIAPSIACLKWWTGSPPGPITVDLVGEDSDTVPDTVAEIAERVVAATSSLTVSNVAEAMAWRPGRAGLHIEDGNETASQALDRLLRGTSLAWAADAAGAILIREITLSAVPVETVRALRVSRASAFKPVTRRRVGYRRNHRIHADSEISAALSYGDGTLLDDYKPDEGGATRNDAGQLLKDAIFSPAFWTVPIPCETFAYADAPKDVAVYIPLNEGEDNFVRYEGTGNYAFAVEPGKSIWVRATVDPGFGPTAPLYSGDDPLYDGDDPLIDYVAVDADWPLSVAIEWLTAARTVVSTEVLVELDPLDERQTFTLPATVPATAELARIAFGHDDTETGVGAWSVWSPWADEKQPSADVTNDNAPTWEVPPDQIIECNSDGTPKSGQLPRVLTFRRKRGETNVSQSTSWSITATGLTASVDDNPASSARGTVTVTAMSAPSDATLVVQSDRDGVTLVHTVKFRKNVGTATGGGGASAIVNMDLDLLITATGFGTDFSPVAIISVGTGEDLRVIASGQYMSQPTVTARIGVKAQYSPTGAGTWTDIDAEVIGSYAPWQTAESGQFDGDFALDQTEAGLTAGDYDVRLAYRINDTLGGVGTPSLYGFGSATMKAE